MQIATLSRANNGKLFLKPAAAFLIRRPIATSRWLQILFLLLLCGFLFFFGLNAGDLWRTEGLRAIIAAEFLRSGNWVVPTLYGEPLFTKPPGMYAAIALVSWPLGEVTTWSARLPSAIAATATVFLFYWYFGRTLGRRGGLTAAAILPASAMWLDKAGAAEIDMLQVFWVTAAILFFLRALEAEEESSPGRPGAGPWWCAALVCVAGGLLTKWTAPAFFYGTVLPLLWWRGRLRLLFGRRHLLSAGLAVGLCLGWVGAAAALGGWDEFIGTVKREALDRLSPAHHDEAHRALAHHPRGLSPWAEALLHPLKILGINLAWSAFALVSLWPGFARLWDEKERRLLQALHCWLWPNLLFWSVIPEHAPRHSFPLFPAIAGLAALVWVAWLTGRLRWPVPRWRPALVLTFMLAGWLVVKLVFVLAVVPARSGERQVRATGQRLASLVPAGQTLYLFRLKDECTLFYYGRPVRRLAGPRQLPSRGEPVYCILSETEWRRWPARRPAEEVCRLTDEQGDPIILVRQVRKVPYAR